MDARVGFFPRLGAWLIDLVVVVVIAVLLRETIANLLPGVTAAMAARSAADLPPQVDRSMMASMMSFSLAMGLIGPVYGLIEGLTGTSPGRLLLGLVVVTDRGTRAPVGQLLSRYAIKQVSALLTILAAFTGLRVFEWGGNVTGVVFLLGCFMVFGDARQALHDRIAKTAVLRRSDLPEPEATYSAPSAG